MKFSVMLLMPVRGTDAGSVLVATARRARLAEELGFHRVWLTENHFSDWGACPNPLLLAAYIAGQTSSIRLGTGVLAPPRYHPIALAEEIAMVDQLSGGRLDVGIGRGYRPEMIEAFGVASDQTHDRFLAVHDGLHRAWAGGEIEPRVRQLPSPPLWIATSHNDEMLRFTADCGYGLLLASVAPVLQQNLATWRASTSGRNPGPCAVSRAIHLASSSAIAVERTREATEWYLMQSSRLRGSTKPPLPVDALMGNFCLYGDAAGCIARLRMLRSLGIDEIACTFDLGGIPEPLVVDSMTRFAAEVMPELSAPSMVAPRTEEARSAATL